MAEPVPIPFSVTSGADRLSQHAQIEQVLTRAREKHQPLRIRLPFTLYDHHLTRGYTLVRDATWNLQLPADQTTPEMIAQLIATIGKCIVAIAREGSEAVERKLEADGGDE